MDNAPPILHNCLNTKGKSPLCQECSVFRRNKEFCEVMVIVIYSCLKSIKGIQVSDVQDILINIIEGIQKGIEGFKGNTKGQFGAWVRTIFRFKKADYFRKPPPKDINIDDIEAEYLPNLETETTNTRVDAEKLISILKEMVGSDKSGCAGFILDYYEYLKEMLNQKEMAEDRGEKANTFNQNLKRCKKKIREALKTMLGNEKYSEWAKYFKD